MGRGKARKSLDLIAAAKAILEEIQPASVRAVCYQLFTMNAIKNMSKNETDKVSSLLTWARENHVIAWSSIVDEKRAPERVSAWENPGAYVETVKRSYRRDRWADQPTRVEVWSEKGTIRGTLAPVLDEFGVTFRVNHGYGSATSVQQMAAESLISDKPFIAFYIGDWDPSGLHMSRIDLPQRIQQYGGDVDLRRLALDQVDVTEDLPFFPAESKKGDPRYRWYVDHFGTRCWEVDALNPNILRQRVENAIVDELDHEAWQRAEVAEQAEQESLSAILNAWPGISRQASEYEPEAPR